MQAVKQLLNAKRDKVVGNHRVEFKGNDKDEVIRHFRYHATVIVFVNDNRKTFRIENGGFNTPSTFRAISSYKHELENKGYTMKLRDEKCISYCESLFYRLEVPTEVKELTKSELQNANYSDYKGEVVKCNKYYIHVEYKGGETLVTDEYGSIYHKLPQYIENFYLEEE